MANYNNAFPHWAEDVLRGIGAPITQANVSFLNAWHAHEGSAASNNPLNVTQKSGPGFAASGVINSAGVANYPSPNEGVAATVATLSPPKGWIDYYPDVRKALQSGDPIGYIGKKPEAVGQLGTWGSHSFASYITGLFKGGFPGGTPTPQGGITGAIGGTIAQVPDTVGGAAQHIPGVKQAESISGFLGKLTSPTTWFRAVYAVGGVVLIGGGLGIIVYELGAKNIPSPAHRLAKAVTG